MKKVKIYAVLHNGRTGAESRKTELHTALMDETSRVSESVFRKMMSKLNKLGTAPKHHYWCMVTEDGRRVASPICGAYVRFE